MTDTDFRHRSSLFHFFHFISIFIGAVAKEGKKAANAKCLGVEMVSLGVSFAAVCWAFFSYDFVGLIVNHKTSGRDSHLGYLGMGCDFIKARLMYTHVIVACLYSEQLAQSNCT